MRAAARRERAFCAGRGPKALAALTDRRDAPSQVLEVDGVPLAQSYAMLMYAGRLAQLVPADALLHAQVGTPGMHAPCTMLVVFLMTRHGVLIAQVESVLFHLIDLDVLLAPSGKEPDAAKKVKLREDLAAGPLLTWFGALEARAARQAGARGAGRSGTADGHGVMNPPCAENPDQEQEWVDGGRLADGGGPGDVRPRHVLQAGCVRGAPAAGKRSMSWCLIVPPAQASTTTFPPTWWTPFPPSPVRCAASDGGAAAATTAAAALAAAPTARAGALPPGLTRLGVALYERVLKHPKVAEWNAMPGH